MIVPFKFLHAADLHLDQPISGLAELPTHLKSELVDCPYRAAGAIFDRAIQEKVDFILLSGDVADFETCGARTIAWLLTQFQKLGEQGIHVYWSTGESDHYDRWPANVELPDNVVVFSSSIVEDVTHRREDQPIATIFASGYAPKRTDATDFSAFKGDAFPIGMTWGELDVASMQTVGIQYWAMGGRHKPHRIEKPECLIAWPGTPQGRTPRESGIRGCYLGRVDAQGKLHLQPIETDSVRWLTQRFAINENIKLDALKEQLAERALKLSADHVERTLLVTWQISTTGDFNPALRKDDVVEALTEWLRDEFGRGSKHCLWTTGVSIEPPARLPSHWYEEDTMLGEYLRTIGRYQGDESINLSLNEYLSPDYANEEWSAIARVIPARRDHVLQHAAIMGIEMLGGERIFESDAEPS